MASAEVTRKPLSLSTTRDSTTGYRAKSWGTDETCKGILLTKGSRQLVLGVGVYAQLDVAFLTMDVWYEGDMLYDSNNTRYYEVETVEPHYRTGSFLFRTLQCTYQPLFEAVASSTATWKTGPSDPRSRTKTYIDTYVTSANVTKDDGSTQATWACIFADPPYPMSREYRATSSPVQGLYVVRQGTEVPLMNPVTKAPYAYDADVPVAISTINSTGCGGQQLNWKMEAELRSVAETYPASSLRSQAGRRPRNTRLGSMTLYETEWMLNYRRDPTT